MIKELKDKKYLRFAIVWLPTLAYFGLIFCLSSRPLPIKLDSFIMMDKWIHLIEYGVLSILFLFSLQKSVKTSFRAVTAMAIMFSGLYGVSDELHQQFVPGRESSIENSKRSSKGGSLIWEQKITTIK